MKKNWNARIVAPSDYAGLKDRVHRLERENDILKKKVELFQKEVAQVYSEFGVSKEESTDLIDLISGKADPSSILPDQYQYSSSMGIVTRMRTVFTPIDPHRSTRIR